MMTMPVSTSEKDSFDERCSKNDIDQGKNSSIISVLSVHKSRHNRSL